MLLMVLDWLEMTRKMDFSELNADRNGDFELALLGELQYEKLTKF